MTLRFFVAFSRKSHKGEKGRGFSRKIWRIYQFCICTAIKSYFWSLVWGFLVRYKSNLFKSSTLKHLIVAVTIISFYFNDYQVPSFRCILISILSSNKADQSSLQNVSESWALNASMSSIRISPSSVVLVSAGIAWLTPYTWEEIFFFPFPTKYFS